MAVNLAQAFKMAFKSILGKKTRSILTMLGIIIGIASVMIIVSVINGYNDKTMSYYENMGTNKVNVSAYLYNGGSIFEGLYTYCQSLGGMVDGVTPNAAVYAQNISSGTRTTLAMDMPPQFFFGSDQYAVCNNFTLAKGRDISYLDVKNYSQVCVLGGRAAQAFFDYKNPLGESISIDGVPFTVIGVYAEKDPDSSYSLDNIAVIPYSANRALGNQVDLSEFTVKCKDAASVNRVITRLEGYLSGAVQEGSGDYYVYSDNQWMDSMNDMALTMSLVLGGIAFISLLVGGIGIMNIMLVTVTERTREIGIRRAIGASRKSVAAQFLIESAMLCGIGGLAGIALGFLGTYVAGQLLVKMALLPSLPITLGAFSFSVVLGMIFGMYPAIKASRLQPVVALRAE